VKETWIIPVLNIEVELKWFTLFLLIFQNTILVLTMRYSRITPSEDGLVYLSSTAVVMAEIFKFFIALIGVFYENGRLYNE